MTAKEALAAACSLVLSPDEQGEPGTPNERSLDYCDEWYGSPNDLAAAILAVLVGWTLVPIPKPTYADAIRALPGLVYYSGDDPAFGPPALATA